MAERLQGLSFQLHADPQSRSRLQVIRSSSPMPNSVLSSHNSLPPSNPRPKRLSRRPRPVLSCSECRQRKLKCDRSLPCSQCLKASRQNQCEFPTPVRRDESVTTTTVRSSHSNHEQSQQTARCETSRIDPSHRNLIVERGVEQHNVGNRARRQQAGSNWACTDMLDNEWPPGILNVVGRETTYLGVGHWRHLVRQFEQVDPFFLKSLQDRDLRHLREELGFLFSSHQQPTAKSVVQRPEFADFIHVLPPKSRCDVLVNIYFEHLEGTHRLLHAPTFLEECDSFWKDAKATPLTWVVQYLAMLTISLLLGTDEDTEQSLTDRLPTVEHWLDLVEFWLKDLQGSVVRDLNVIRTNCLYLMTIQAMEWRRDIHNSDPRPLISAAIAAGFHREPGQFEQVSEFHCEMRRRVWASIVELSLQYALAFSFPPLIRRNDFDTQFPSNVNETDLFESMLEPATTYPTSELFDSTIQHVLASSIPARLEALEMVNRLGHAPNYHDIASVSRDIEENLRRIPGPLRVDFLTEETAPSKIYRAILLDVYIRRILLTLHSPFLLRYSEGHHRYSKAAAVENASAVLSYLAILNQRSQDLTPVREALQHQLAMDFFNASLVLCLEIRAIDHSLKAPNASDRLLSAETDCESPRDHRARLLGLVELALENFFFQLPSSTMHLYLLYLSMVLNIVKARESLEVAEIGIKKDLHRIVATLRASKIASDAVIQRSSEWSNVLAPNFELPEISPGLEGQSRNDLGSLSVQFNANMSPLGDAEVFDEFGSL